MDKESAEFLVNRFQFLNGRNIKLKDIPYAVESVHIEETADGPEPIVRGRELKHAHSSNEGQSRNMNLDHELRTEVSVMLAEVESLPYDEQGRTRLHELLQDIYRKIPIQQNNFMILEKLKPHLGYWADWDEAKDGTDSFNRVKHLLLTELQDL